MVTREIDPGTTPYQIKCETCGRWARSMFYAISPTLAVTHEWYRPDSLDGFRDEVKEHVTNGGLLLRRVKK